MPRLQALTDLVLLISLAGTFVQARRLHSVLSALKGDQGGLGAALAQFGEGTREVKLGLDSLRGLTLGAASQMELGQVLKDDLGFLIDRGEALAGRLEALVRAARPLTADKRHRPVPEHLPEHLPAYSAEPAPADMARASRAATAQRVRSQAERDLLNALRTPG